MTKPPFYIRATLFLAPILIIFGLVSLLLGIGIATGYIVEPEPSYYLGNRSSGAAIDDGVYRIIAGIVLGAIGKIGTAISNNSST